MVLAVAVWLGGVGSAQSTPPSDTDTQIVEDVSFIVGNRIDVQMSGGGDGDVTIQSADSDVVDDETVNIDYVFGSLSGGITAEVTNFVLDGTNYTPDNDADNVGVEDAGLGTSVVEGEFNVSNGIRLALCTGNTTTYSTTSCEPLADPANGWTTVNVLQAQPGSLSGALLLSDDDAGVGVEGETASVKFAAKKFGSGPEEAIDALDLTVTFTVADQ